MKKNIKLRSKGCRPRKRWETTRMKTQQA